LFGGILLSGLRSSKSIGIFWSHNEEAHPKWLTYLTKELGLQGFTWWSARWRIKTDQLTIPVTGYIWLTTEGKITHKALIERIETLHQPQKELAQQVYENRKKMGYYHSASPLEEYLNGKRKTLTLLKMTKFEELQHPLGLNDLRLHDGQPVERPPQGYYRIMLP
jgi:predicted transcriptional regulator